MSAIKNVYLIVTILSVFSISAKPVEEPPVADISNGLIHARLYLPDAAAGYYRGARFDWSGVMPKLEYQGHSYFGQWFEKYSATAHDAIMGPVEDFFPVGYQEANVGESFLKIGVGMVSKPQEVKYSFVTPYRITNGGSWKVRKKPNEVQFIHKLEDKEYGYLYKKTVQLLKGKPVLVLSHSLTNTGKQAIKTEAYDHNFFVMDKQSVGKQYVVSFPFIVSGQAQGTGEFGELRGNQITFLKELTKKDHLQYLTLTGFGTNANDYDIRIENHATGAAVRITSDQPLSRLAFWSAIATICPEPYIAIKVNPGQKFSWKIFYEFYTCKKNN